MGGNNKIRISAGIDRELPTGVGHAWDTVLLLADALERLEFTHATEQSIYN
jgi:hypothetical protein